MKKTKLVVAVFIPVMCLLIGLVLKQHDKKPAPSQLSGKIKVETTKPKPVNLIKQIDALGSLESRDRVELSPQIAGQISRIYFKAGSFVKKGVPLIQLDATVYQSQLESAKAKLRLSQMNYQRIEQLSKRRLSSEQELDQVLADLRDNENAVKVKKAELARLTLRAPFSGTLGAKAISVGQYVSVGQALVSLVANQQLKVQYSVPERYLPDLQINQTVNIESDTFPELTFSGKVDFISPTIDKDTRSIQVEAIIDNKKQELSPGLFVKIRHFLGQKRASLLIPEESLIPTINGQKLYTLIEGKANAISVTIGARHDAMVEVLSGLSARDEVITRGHHKLKDGSLVEVIKSRDSA